MIICGQCGTSSEGAKFCLECGAALVVSERPAAEERKVVTALFCDLVGFTSVSETADPEDVNTMLDAYAARELWRPLGEFGVVPEHAFALLGHGRCLVGLGRPGEAAPVLQQARGLFHALGATPGIAETDALLETTTALSS